MENQPKGNKMKKAILILILLATPATLAAAAAEETIHERCTALSQLAEQTMRNRQDGVSIVKMMETSQDETPVGRLARAIILDAYKRPKFRTKSYQVEAATSFSNDVYLECIEELK